MSTDELSHSNVPVNVSPSTRLAIPVAVFACYASWYIMTPVNSSTFSFLATLRFERVLAVCMIASAMMFGRLGNLASPIVISATMLAGWMYVSAILSPFADYKGLVHWQDEYWKLIVFFLASLSGFAVLGDVRSGLKAIVVIVLLYQLYSWLDFMRGGSYVSQQGMRRMIGTWSGGGVGAANGWGSLSMFSLPFAVFLHRRAHTPREKNIARLCFVLCIASVVNSGTRGALMVVLPYCLYIGRKFVLRVNFLFMFACLTVVGIQFLPERITNRYWDQIVGGEKDELESDRMAQLAQDSKNSRIDGLIDGFRIANQHPIFGSGPGTSEYSRTFTSSKYGILQLHNLYGQIVGELGYVGFGISVILVIVFFKQIYPIPYREKRVSDSSLGDSHVLDRIECRNVVVSAFILLMSYGTVSHSLYDFKWPLVLALAVGLEQTKFAGQAS